MTAKVKNTCILLLAALWVFAGLGIARAERGELKRLTVRYQATVKNIPSQAEVVEVWLPYPKSGEYQRIYDLKVTSPYPVSVAFDSEYGNGFLHLTVSNPTRRQFTVTMEFDADRYQAVNSIDPDKVGELPADLNPYHHYLQPNPHVEVNDEVRRISRKITGDKSRYIDKVTALIDYVFDNMDYDKSMPGYGKGDIQRALRLKKGNCVDFHTLFMSLAYAANVPVRYLSNFDLPFGKMAPNYCSFGFHCSLEVLLPNYGWVPIDISHAKKGRGSKTFYFGSSDYYRLTIGEGRDVMLAPAQKGPRLQHVPSKPYIEVDGIPYEEVQTELEYKDRSV